MPYLLPDTASFLQKCAPSFKIFYKVRYLSTRHNIILVFMIYYFLALARTYFFLTFLASLLRIHLKNEIGFNKKLAERKKSNISCLQYKSSVFYIHDFNLPCSCTFYIAQIQNNYIILFY